MPEARERSSSGVSALAERFSPAAYAISAAVIVVGAIAGFGGLETVADEPVARADAGQEIPGKQLDVAIEDAWLADGFDPFFEPESGQRYLAVRARVTNVSDTPVTTVRDNVLVDGLTGSEGEPQADEAIRIGESSTNPVLQPGVAEEIVLLWQVDSIDWSAGSTITVRVLDKTLREGFLFDASWSDPVVTAQVPLVIGDRGFDDMTRDVVEIDDPSEVAP
jgi:hypothetical protein